MFVFCLCFCLEPFLFFPVFFNRKEMVAPVAALPVLPTSLLIAVLWATVPVLHKYLLVAIPYELVILGASVFYTIAAIVFVAYNWTKLASSISIKEIRPFHILLIVFIGVFAGFLPNVLNFILLHKNDTAIVTTLTFTSPIFTIALAYLFLSERVSRKDFICIMAIVAAVMVISLPNRPHGEMREFKVSAYEE